MAKESESEKLATWFADQSFSTQKEILAQLEGLHGEAVEAKKRDLMAQLAELGGTPATPKRKGPSKGASVAAMYREPKSGFEWSGRGAMPKVFREMGITDKKDLEKYRVG